MKSKLRSQPLGIRQKVIYTFLAFAFIMLGILWLFQTVLLNPFYQSIRLQQITSQADTYAEQLHLPNFYPTLVSSARQNDSCVIIATDQGVQYSVDVTPSCLIHRLPDYNYEYFYNLTRENGGQYTLSINMNEAQTISPPFSKDTPVADHENAETIVYSRLAHVGGKEYCIIINATLEPITATVTTLRFQLFVISILFILIAAILALFLSQSISSPLVTLNKKSKLLGKRQATDFTVKGYREVSELGDTLTHAASELQKTDRLQRELVANISHDLRTPLTMIAGYAEVMRDIPGENTPENAQIILDEARRLSTIVSDVLDVSRIQSGTEPMIKERFDLTHDTREICQRFLAMTEREGYTIHYVTPDHPCMVMADRMMISRVIYNLINNAVTHTGENRSISVTQSVRGSVVRISVADEGPGIPDDQLDSIWERYYKIDKEHKRAAVGSGLGLSIVKTILSMHSATYGVASSVGKGSVFWFELPILEK
ncbi:MAG: HAMP domain-containing histidine kinase [Clostridia bacterium]|nr:HAMP domain-containing histidine kinase [Clostridia bacterium]